MWIDNRPIITPNKSYLYILFCSLSLLTSFLLVGDCSFTECPYYANCVTQRDGTALCACSQLCSSSFRPVCGSNSRTYWNECFLKREACFMRQNTSVLSLGTCSKFYFIIPRFTSFLCGRRGGLVISALDYGSRGPGSSPGRVIVLCSWARHFTLTVPLSTQEYKRVPVNSQGNLKNAGR